MDDNQKIVDQNTNAPSTPEDPVPGQSQPQSQSVGSVHKEQGPVRAVIEKSDVELKIDKELEDIGV